MTTFHIVVGDDYLDFADGHADVVTASAMLRRLEQPELWAGRHQVLLGQGIAENTRLALLAACQERGIAQVEAHANPAALYLTHKRNRKNVLITEPVKRGAGGYRFDLMLGDQNDRLSDHVTGQHVGAMLLMEAARQAVVVTLECEYAAPGKAAPGLVLERFDSRFDNYAFPLPTALTVTMAERGAERGVQARKNNAVSLTIAFEQAGQQVAEMVLDVTLVEKDLLAKMEARKARKSVETLRGALQDTPADALAAA